MPLFSIQNDFRYDVVRKIFEGGMGVVYEAEQRGARDFVKRVAIKVVRANYASQKTFIDNFIGEAKLVADLIHTNIVQTYHLAESRGVYFMAMELIRGVNIALDTAPIDACPSSDVNGDGAVAVNELVAGVNAALDGCPAG